MGTIKKFSFNYTKKLKCQNARSNSYLFDLWKKKEGKSGLNASAIGLVNKIPGIELKKKSVKAPLGSEWKTMYTTSAST